MSAYLLDSCAVVWLANGDKRLPATVRKSLATADELYVSPISAWEISRKAINGTLILPESARTVWRKLVETYHLKVLPVTPEISFVATELPEIHKDPADCLIIATAKVYHLAIVTSDHRFPQYGVEVVP